MKRSNFHFQLCFGTPLPCWFRVRSCLLGCCLVSFQLFPLFGAIASLAMSYLCIAGDVTDGPLWL